MDWEVEFAVVIGKKASYVENEHATEHVFFSTTTLRGHSMERGDQLVKGKSADTFAPIGPFLATGDEIPDSKVLDVRLKVNGEVRQKSNTACMIFDVPALVTYISQFMTLVPGDIISTGTPAGIGNEASYLSQRRRYS